MLTYVYGKQGVPTSYREQDGFGVHAYKLYNDKGEYKYVKFNFRSKQGEGPERQRSGCSTR